MNRAVASVVHRLPGRYHAAAWMILSCVAFAVLWGMIRYASHHLHPFAIVFFRNFFGLFWMLPLMLKVGRGLFAPVRLRLHSRRAFSGLVATFAVFYAIANAPLVTVLSINYAAPLIATTFAALLLGEKIRARRITALVVGFVGVLIVLGPGEVGMTPGIGAAIIGMLATAVSIVSIKSLTATESPQVITLYSFLLMTPVSLIVALPYFAGLNWPILLFLLAMGLVAVIGQHATASAFRLAEASAVLPFDFVRFGLTILIGTFIFGDPASKWTLIGGAIILSSTVYLAHRESVLAARVKPASTPRLS